MKTYKPSKRYSWLLVIAGIFGLAASASLTIEKIFLLEDPNYQLSCSLNEIFACGSIVTTEQASAFGFANSVIGVAAFPVLITLGIISVMGIVLPRFVLGGLTVGLIFAQLFVLWLVYQSLYVIGALCPWCMVVWAAVVPLTFYLVAEWQETQTRKQIAHLATLGWFLIVIALIVARFYI